MPNLRLRLVYFSANSKRKKKKKVQQNGKVTESPLQTYRIQIAIIFVGIVLLLAHCDIECVTARRTLLAGDDQTFGRICCVAIDFRFVGVHFLEHDLEIVVRYCRVRLV